MSGDLRADVRAALVARWSRRVFPFPSWLTWWTVFLILLYAWG